MTKGPVIITTYVECGMEYDQEDVEIPREEWDALTPSEREQLCVDAAVDHQNNFAPCGWKIADADDRASVES